MNAVKRREDFDILAKIIQIAEMAYIEGLNHGLADARAQRVGKRSFSRTETAKRVLRLR